MEFTAVQLQAMKQRESNVPCGSCQACCKQDVVALGPDDKPDDYRWHIEHGRKVLDRKPSGECTYLTPNGCGIHGSAPKVCRSFDCRVLFLLTPKSQRRIRIVQNPTMQHVYDAAKKRLNTLEP